MFINRAVSSFLSRLLEVFTLLKRPKLCSIIEYGVLGVGLKALFSVLIKNKKHHSQIDMQVAFEAISGLYHAA